MAKKNSNMGLLLGGAALLLLLGNRNRQPPQGYIPQFPGYPPGYVPPRPPQSGQALAQWAQSIMSVWGNVSSLWEPGGPFHRNDFTEEQAQWVAQGISNANFDPSAWLNP